MRSPASSLPTIAVFGGRGDLITSPHAEILTFASHRFGGAGDTRRLVATLATGHLDGLICWARFLGHSDSDRALAASRSGGVPTCLVLGGRTSVRRAIQRLASGGR